MADTEEKVAEETKEETPTEETPAEEAPAEETPTEEAKATEETPAEEAPAEEAPTEEAPAEEAPAEETPAVETPAEEAPTEEAPAEEAPAEETTVEEAPAEKAPAEEAPTEEAPTEETPAEETPAEETPADKETPAEEAPAEDAPTEEAPAESEEAPAETEAAPDVEEGEAAAEENGDNETGMFSEEDKETIRNAFYLFDRDGNGTISADELGTLLRTLGQEPSEAEVEEILSVLDANKSGAIEEEEFMRIIEERAFMPTEHQEESYRAAFRVFDKDNSGKISPEELKSVLTDDFIALAFSEDCISIFRSVVKSYGRMRMNSLEAEEFVRAADVDDDGLINYEEFVKLFCGKA